MWISRKEYNQIIERYEKRIDDLLNRLMSANFSEYKFVKETKPSVEELSEPSSRTDEDEWRIEQERLNDMKELQEKAESLKEQINA